MIQLTEKVIAVEVPNDATVKELIVTENNRKQIIDACTKKGKGTKVLVGDLSLIGVTPLLEKQCKDIVEALTERSLSMTLLHGYKNYDSSKKYKSCYPFMQATQSFNSLLESKGLDINKKYAIIKIEK